VSTDNYNMTGPAVQRHLSISDTTLWRWMRDPTLNFPKPTVTNGRNYFLRSDIEAWDRQRRNASLPGVAA
jgi:predicted DNA-binding transcriptional regulator AlpA